MRRSALVLAAWGCLAAPAAADFYDVLNYARADDLANVRQRLAAGDDPNAPSHHQSYAPLQFAAGNGNTEMVRLLLAAGADTEYRDHNGDRALLWAAREGHAEAVKLLLDAGSPADSDDPYGNTPLMLAAGGGHAETVRLLLAAGADIGRFDQSSRTPLHYGARAADAAIVELLLEAGANPNVISDSLRETPLHEASIYGDAKTIALLAEADVALEARNYEGLTALHLAAIVGNAVAVRALLAAGADADAHDDAGRTPLVAALQVYRVESGDAALRLLAEAAGERNEAFALALWSGVEGVALRLFERGVDLAAARTGDRSALAGAAQLADAAILRTLLDETSLATEGTGALIAAADAGRLEAMVLLLAHGVPVDGRDALGATSLLRAIHAGRAEAVALLLEHGADPHAVDDAGQGAEPYMTMRPLVLQLVLDDYSRSAAWHPTTHIDAELERLAAGHRKIRALLAAY